MTLSIKQYGDKEGALRCIPEAKRLLYLLKANNPLKLPSLWMNRYLADGSFVQVSSIFGNDYISITSPSIPIIGEISLPTRLLLYLVTIAIPVRDESWGDFVAWSDYDVDNLFVCKTYAYRIDEDSRLLIPDSTKIELHQNVYTIGGGLTLTMQEGYLDNFPDHYATLSNMYSQEEEIGSLNWREFQTGGGFSLDNPGVPDTNTYWGQGILRFMKYAVYGSTIALENPDPTTALETSYSARKGYVLNGDEVIYNDLIYLREVISGEYVPAYWDWERGQAMFVGIVEYLNPNYRWVYRHKINVLDIRTNATKTTIIAEDEHELQNYPTESGLDTSLNWKYHVPIMTVTDDKALMRIVKRVGTNKTCWESTLTEELVIGKSDTHTDLDDISIHNDGGITETTVIGSDTINNYETKGYYLDGCQQDDQTFTFTGGGGYTVSGNSIIAGSSVCGRITATGTCTSCGITATKKIIAQGGHWLQVSSCARENLPYGCGPGLVEFVYDYANGMAYQSTYCIASPDNCSHPFDCTGECTPVCLRDCEATGSLIWLCRGTACYEWSC